MATKVKSILSKLDCPPAGKYILAVSGGVDSVVLLELLHQRPELDLVVAHFNHGMRQEADSDEAFVRSLTEDKNLLFVTARTRLAGASENTARRARYAFLRQAVRDYGAQGIITAHHLDDRLETSFFNVMRGTNRRGFTALRSENGIYRPLLNIRKSELTDYARDRHLDWREDHTNRDLRYSRNHIRHRLLPRARQLEPRFDSRFLSYIKVTEKLNSEIDGLLGQLLDKFAEPLPSGLSLPRRWAASLHPTVTSHLVVYAFRRVSPDTELSRKQVQRMVQFIKEGKTGSSVPVSGKLKLEMTYAKVAITFDKGQTDAPSETVLMPGNALRFGSHRLFFSPDHQPGSLAVKPGPLTVRSVRPGDRIPLVGMNGRKKLQDLFVDRKVDRNLRPSWPVVTDQYGSIIWVPGLGVSRELLPGNHYLRFELDEKDI